jgi:hypothetical protein
VTTRCVGQSVTTPASRVRCGKSRSVAARRVGGACERHIILNIPNSKIYELAPTSKIDILPAATSAMGVPDGFAALPSGTWTISDRTSVGRPLIVSISTQTGFNGFSATVR